MRSISCLVLPIPDHVFFEQTVFERQFSDDLLQCAGLAAQVLYLVRGCCAGRIAGEPLLPGLKEVFRPAVIQILDDPFTTAQLGDALLAAQALQHNADLLFCRELPACRPPDVFHDLFRRFLHRPRFLSHLRSLKGYDEPEILPSSTRPICLIGADGGQSVTSFMILALRTANSSFEMTLSSKPSSKTAVNEASSKFVRHTAA